jgi:RNA polymerase sigma-70 factor, ECF subfamily
VTTAEPIDPPTSETHVIGSPLPAQQLGELVRSHFGFVWRVLRRLGLSESDADDAAQQVFLSASRRLADISAGSERGFLFTTAVNVAAHAQRRRLRLREAPDDEIDEQRNSAPGADELIDRRRARELLDEILEAMPVELRLVFVLFEVEQLTMAEIAEMLAIRPGTVASRLRRARADFAAKVKRIEARLGFPGGKR